MPRNSPSLATSVAPQSDWSSSGLEPVSASRKRRASSEAISIVGAGVADLVGIGVGVGLRVGVAVGRGVDVGGGPGVRVGVAVGIGVDLDTRVDVGTNVGVGAGVTVATSDNRWLTIASTVLGISGVTVGGTGVATEAQATLADISIAASNLPRPISLPTP